MKVLLKKLGAAAKTVELSLEAKSKEKVAAGEFALSHQYHMLHSYHELGASMPVQWSTWRYREGRWRYSRNEGRITSWTPWRRN
jgi:hypothetical protein